MSDEQEDYTRSFVTRSDIDKEAAWEVNKKKIEKPGYVYIRHTSDEYVSGIRNASDGVAWGASQLNLKDLKGAVGTGADYDDTDIQRELAAQAKRIEANEDNISDLDKNKENVGHTHDDLVTGEHDHEQYQLKGDYATKAELSTGLAGKADDPHTHDYAADDHDHDTVYQPKGDYATGDHGHDDYETKVDAKLVHEALTESIAGKADDDHDHSGIYAPFDHGHENLATDDHAHDEYQPKGDYADSVHIHTEYAETGDIEELSAAIAEEAKDRANADSILQDQVTANKESIEAISEKGYDDSWIQPALDKKSDDPHTHDEYLTDLTHDHDGTYQPAGDYATKTELSDGLAGKEDVGHTHDDYTSKDYVDNQDREWDKVAKGYTDDAVKNHTHDDYLTDLPDHEHPHDHNEDYAGKDHLHNEYLTELPTHDHPHGHDEYQPKGDYATKEDLKGKEDVGHTHDTAHDHEEYANVEELEKLKGEIIDIEAELEAIAPNREKGDWEATDTGAPRPGQANLANPSFTAEQNILVINQVDANDETHTFNEVEEGDNIEIAVDENNLGLYEVGPSTRSDVVNLNLTLIKGQGSIKTGDQIKINIFGLADTNLNLEELDERYLQLSGGTMTGDLSAPNIALSGVGDKSIKENDNNRIKFGGKVIITRGDSNNAEGFEIKGKTANGSNDHLLSVYHNSSGIDAINYYGKQDGNENIATVKHVKDKIDGHTHEMPTHNHDDRYIRKDEDTNLTHTTDHRFTNIKSQQAKNAEGVNDTSEPWGIHFDLDAGNSWKNQFQVGTSRHGYALQVNGGSGKEVWIGGSISQKDGDLTNPKDENYITRKNLDEHNHDGQYLPSGDWPEDQPEMSGAEIMDWSMTMFNLNDVNQKLQDAAIAQKADIDHTHEGVGAEHTHDEYVAKSGSTMSGMLTINKDSNVLFTGKKAGETTIQVWADGTVKQLETNGNSDPECLVNRQNLTNEIKKLENRIDALEPEPEPDAEITLTMEMGAGSNGRPTGSGASEGKIAVWYLYPEGTTSPKNEAKLHMGPDALDANIWTTVTEMHLIQGNKKQVWKVNPPWITGGDNNVLHASSNDIKGDTLTVDAETRILFFGPNFPPVEDETEEEESFIKTITLPGFTRSSFYDENSFFAKNSSGVAAVPFQSSKVFITSTRDDPYGLEKVATSMVAVAIGTFLIIREDNGRCVMSWKLGQMRTEGNGTLEIERGEELTADGGWGPTDSTYTLVLKDV